MDICSIRLLSKEFCRLSCYIKRYPVFTVNMRLLSNIKSPTISASKDTSMQDEKITIKIEGLKPRSLFTLHSYTSSASPGKLFESVACYKSDEHGCLNLDKDKSLMGSYQGVEPMGLFWSMQPSPANKHKYARFVKMDVTTPLVVDIDIYEEEVKDVNHIHQLRVSGGLKEKQIASKQLNRLYMKPGTKRIPLNMKEHGIHGTLFIPPGEGPFPGIITMHGGVPGISEFKAALLASKGYTCLTLAYHGLKGLPRLNERFTVPATFQNNIELEYFERAIDILRNHQSVQKSLGIGVLNNCASVPIGLMIAANLKHIRCAVQINGPTYAIYANYTYKGITYKSLNTTYSPTHTDPDVITSYSINVPDPLHPSPPECLINFADQHHIPFLFLVSMQDKLLPTSDYADAAEVLLKQSKHPDYKIIRYPGAGHLLEPSYTPLNSETWFPALGKLFMYGGENPAHERAQELSWNQQLDFFKRNLLPKSAL